MANDPNDKVAEFHSAMMYLLHHPRESVACPWCGVKMTNGKLFCCDQFKSAFEKLEKELPPRKGGGTVEADNE